MRKKDLQKLREENIGKLNELARQKRIEILKLKAETRVGREKDFKKVRNLRKDLAQILTMIREKELVEGDRIQEKHS